METSNKKILFVGGELKLDDNSKKYLKSMPARIDFNIISDEDTLFIEDYFKTPSVKDQVLNISHYPGCGLFEFLRLICEKESVTLATIRVAHADDSDNFTQIVNDILALKQGKVIIAIDDINRASSNVLMNVLDFLNTFDNPRVKIITTTINSSEKGFDMGKYGTILHESGPLQLLNIV